MYSYLNKSIWVVVIILALLTSCCESNETIVWRGEKITTMYGKFYYGAHKLESLNINTVTGSVDIVFKHARLDSLCHISIYDVKTTSNIPIYTEEVDVKTILFKWQSGLVAGPKLENAVIDYVLYYPLSSIPKESIDIDFSTTTNNQPANEVKKEEPFDAFSAWD